jgi:hypothetical protein
MELMLQPATEHRLNGRSNVFLAASMDSGSGYRPVRIRNISAGGALVEGNPLPALGATVRLVRGELAVAGKLAWQAAGLAGIEFAGSIDVPRWVQRIGHSGQQRVDTIVMALRDSAVPPREQRKPATNDTLPAISAALDQLCERLAATPNMSIELGEDLLKLDVIAQSLRRLATGKAF